VQIVPVLSLFPFRPSAFSASGVTLRSLGRADTYSAVFFTASLRSVSSRMSWRLKVASVLWPPIRRATVGSTPDRTMFRIAERRRSWKRRLLSPARLVAVAQAYYLDTINRARLSRRLVNRLQNMGYHVDLSEVA